jgi:hypothetical protein
MDLIFPLHVCLAVAPRSATASHSRACSPSLALFDHSDRITCGFAGPAVVTDQVQALHTPDVLRAGQESDASLQEGLLSFGLHDAPSPSLDLCRVADVHDDRNDTRGRLAIYEM